MDDRQPATTSWSANSHRNRAWCSSRSTTDSHQSIPTLPASTTASAASSRWPRQLRRPPRRCDSAGGYPSRHENGSSYLLTLDDIITSARNYLGDRPELRGSADVDPIRATDLSGLAPAVIGVAHHDPLQDEGLAYANKLAASGVDVFAKDLHGMIHTFASLYAISTGANQALRELITEFSQRARVPRSIRGAAREIRDPRR
jgi:hypothetical protein